MVLQDGKAKADVKKAAVRSFLIIYSAAIVYGVEGLPSAFLLREPSGIQTIFALLREAIEGIIRTEDHQQIDWLLIALLIKLINVMCFNKITQNKLIVDEHIKIIFRVLERAISDKKREIQFLCFRLLSLFVENETVKLEIISMLNVKTLFGALKDASNLDRKFIMSILTEIITNSQMHQIIKGLSWAQGLETLLNTCFSSEPMAVSMIFQQLTKDHVILSQMNNMMSPEYLEEVVKFIQGQANFYADPLVPVHLRKSVIVDGENIYVGSLNLTNVDQMNLLRTILKQNYECASSDAEMRLYPELPYSADGSYSQI